MYVSSATTAGDSGQNEDWVGTTPTTLVVLDGVSAPPGTSTGCQHGTRWYVNQLGSRLLMQMTASATSPAESLAIAIRETANAHRETCDLTHPGTPSAAVAIVRMGSHELSYLVLADTVVVVDVDGRLVVVTDDRVEHVAADAHAETLRHPVGSPEHVKSVAELSRTQRRCRNQPGGYWVASTTPAAADQAITGTLPLGECHRAAILTDGASRIVDRFGLATWEELLGRIATDGPSSLLAWNRKVEESDPNGERWPRYKTSDDATAAYVDLTA